MEQQRWLTGQHVCCLLAYTLRKFENIAWIPRCVLSGEDHEIIRISKIQALIYQRHFWVLPLHTGGDHWQLAIFDQAYLVVLLQAWKDAIRNALQSPDNAPLRLDTNWIGGYCADDTGSLISIRKGGYVMCHEMSKEKRCCPQQLSTIQV